MTIYWDVKRMEMKKTIKQNRYSGATAEEFRKRYETLFSKLPGSSISGKNSPKNVMGQIMVNPEIADLFFPYWVGSKLVLSLSVKEQELIILRSAVIFKCDYVWGHHVPVMLEDGMQLTEINKIALPIEKGGWSDKDKSLLEAVDAIYGNADISEAIWQSLRTHFDDKNIMDIITTCSQYLLFNATNNIFGLPLEHDGLPCLPH